MRQLALIALSLSLFLRLFDVCSRFSTFNCLRREGGSALMVQAALATLAAQDRMLLESRSESENYQCTCIHTRMQDKTSQVSAVREPENWPSSTSENQDTWRGCIVGSETCLQNRLLGWEIEFSYALDHHFGVVEDVSGNVVFRHPPLKHSVFWCFRASILTAWCSGLEIRLWRRAISHIWHCRWEYNSIDVTWRVIDSGIWGDLARPCKQNMQSKTLWSIMCESVTDIARQWCGSLLPTECLNCREEQKKKRKQWEESIQHSRVWLQLWVLPILVGNVSGTRKSLPIAKNRPKPSQESSEQIRPSIHKIKVAHRNRSDFCDLRLRCPSWTPEIASDFPRQTDKGMPRCDLGVRWKKARDLRFRTASSEPRAPSFCRNSGDLGPSTTKSLAIMAMVRFRCAKLHKRAVKCVALLTVKNCARKGEASLLTFRAFLLTVEVLCWQSVEVLMRCIFPLYHQNLWITYIENSFPEYQSVKDALNCIELFFGIFLRKGYVRGLRSSCLGTSPFLMAWNLQHF